MASDLAMNEQATIQQSEKAIFLFIITVVVKPAILEPEYFWLSKMLRAGRRLACSDNCNNKVKREGKWIVDDGEWITNAEFKISDSL